VTLVEVGVQILTLVGVVGPGIGLSWGRGVQELTLVGVRGPGIDLSWGRGFRNCP